MRSRVTDSEASDSVAVVGCDEAEDDVVGCDAAADDEDDDDDDDDEEEDDGVLLTDDSDDRREDDTLGRFDVFSSLLSTSRLGQISA